MRASLRSIHRANRVIVTCELSRCTQLRDSLSYGDDDANIARATMAALHSAHAMALARNPHVDRQEVMSGVVTRFQQPQQRRTTTSHVYHLPGHSIAVKQGAMVILFLLAAVLAGGGIKA